MAPDVARVEDGTRRAGLGHAVPVSGRGVHRHHGGLELFVEEGADAAQRRLRSGDQILEADDQVLVGPLPLVTASQPLGVDPAGHRAARPPLAVGPQRQRGLVAIAGVADHVHDLETGVGGEHLGGVALDEAGLRPPPRLASLLGVLAQHQGEELGVGGRATEEAPLDLGHVGLEEANVLVMPHGVQTGIEVGFNGEIAETPIEVGPHVGAHGGNRDPRVGPQESRHRRLPAPVEASHVDRTVPPPPRAGRGGRVVHRHAGGISPRRH